MYTSQKLMGIELNSINFIEFNDDEDSYSKEIKMELHEEITSQLHYIVHYSGPERKEITCPPISYDAFSSNINWSKDRTKVGSLSKRILKFLKVVISNKELFSIIDQNHLSQIINQVILRNELPSKAYYYDITDRADWSAGTFGDIDSCFLRGGAQSYSWEPMYLSAHPDVYFFRIFQPRSASLRKKNFATKPGFYLADDNSDFIGTARCVIYKPTEAGKLFIFNSYGYSRKAIGKLIKRVFNFKQIPQTVKFSTEIGIYINGDKADRFSNTTEIISVYDAYSMPDKVNTQITKAMQEKEAKNTTSFHPYMPARTQNRNTNSGLTFEFLDSLLKQYPYVPNTIKNENQLPF